MDGITIYELNERMGRAAEAGRKLGELPMLLADAAKALNDFSNRINSIVGRIHEGGCRPVRVHPVVGGGDQGHDAGLAARPLRTGTIQYERLRTQEETT